MATAHDFTPHGSGKPGARRWKLSILALSLGIGVGVWVWFAHLRADSSENKTHRLPTDVAAQPATGSSSPPDPVPGARTDASALLSPDRQADLLDVLRWKLANSAKQADVADILATLARTDPARTLELARQLARSEDEQFQFVAGVLRRWSDADLPAALEWAGQNAGELSQPGMPSLVEAVLRQAAKNQPEAIAGLVEAAFVDGANSASAITKLTDEITTALLQSGHLEMARTILDRIARGVMADTLSSAPFERVASSLAGTAPASAAAWLQSLPPSPARNFGLANVAGVWAGQDPQAALIWALSLPSNGGRGDALDRAFARWAEQDGDGAIRWIAAHEAEPEADLMISRLLSVSPVTRAHPRVAANWADLIQDEQLHAQTVEQITQGWAAQDLAAATRYLNENTRLTAERKRQLLQTIVPAP
ncbi:MAG: hypothetical protein ACREF9_10205 [Opitutaceae bacterium]